MNRRQKIVQQQYLNNEKGVIKRLNSVYSQALKDINANIEKQMKRFDPVTGDLPQSAIYQIKYQKQLKSQVEGILNALQTKQFVTVSDYLDTCYTDGFVGSIFDMHGQGVPLTMPIDQQSVVRAVQLDSKISKGLYTRLGEDVDLLKRKITAQVSRSIVTGTSFADCAKQLSGYTRIGYNNAVRIARTEGHRVQTTATMDAMEQAKERGADVVKQWDSTLDGKTRESHVAVDGQIREMDEPFGNGLMYPGDPTGPAAEVVNCRCALLQRARWAVGDGEFTKWNNFTRQLETFSGPDDYDEFKKTFFSAENKRYMNYVQQMEKKYKTRDWATIGDRMTAREYKHYSELLANNPVFNTAAPVTHAFRTFADGADASKFFGQRPDRALRRSNREEYDRQREAYENSMFGSWNNGLSGDEYSAIAAYTGDDYAGINGLLRTQMTEKMVNDWNATSQQTLQSKILNITNAVDRFDLQDSITVYRTCEEDVFENLKKQVGGIFTDHGFTSTSVLKTPVASGNVRMAIDVPAGRGVGAWVNPLSGAEDEEWEFLLQRGTIFRVDAIEEIDGGTQIHMTVVGNDRKDWKYASSEEVEARWKRLGMWDSDSADKI